MNPVSFQPTIQLRKSNQVNPTFGNKTKYVAPVLTTVALASAAPMLFDTYSTDTANTGLLNRLHDYINNKINYFKLSKQQRISKKSILENQAIVNSYAQKAILSIYNIANRNDRKLTQNDIEHINAIKSMAQEINQKIEDMVNRFPEGSTIKFNEDYGDIELILKDGLVYRYVYDTNDCLDYGRYNSKEYEIAHYGNKGKEISGFGSCSESEDRLLTYKSLLTDYDFHPSKFRHENAMCCIKYEDIKSPKELQNLENKMREFAKKAGIYSEEREERIQRYYKEAQERYNEKEQNRKYNEQLFSKLLKNLK